MHIMYTDCDGHFHSVERDFASIHEAEAWLTEIGALKWEIGF